MMWITVNNVTDFTGLKPQHLKLDKTDTTKLTQIVEDWILQSQDLIKSYTHNNFTDETVPDAVRNVCLRLTSNMVALAMARRDTPITQPNDWTVTILSSEIFSDDLKDDLDAYVNQAVTGKSDKVYVFTVKGDDPF
jgi:hypothetical protein